MLRMDGMLVVSLPELVSSQPCRKPSICIQTLNFRNSPKPGRQYVTEIPTSERTKSGKGSVVGRRRDADGFLRGFRV